LLTGEADGCWQLDQGNVILQPGGIPFGMQGVLCGGNSDLGWLDNVHVVCAKDDFEGSASVGTVGNSQNPVGGNDGSSAGVVIVNNHSYIPVGQIRLKIAE
jgi:hypothetical protein